MSIGSHERPRQGLSDNWITPRHITDALGPFDLDPCACIPQPWRHAAHQYDRDGLVRPWHGRIWLNPPYGPALDKWLSRLAEHGNGIALVFARTEIKPFFDHVWTKAHGLLFLKGRIAFYRPDGTRAKHTGGAPSVLIAYGYKNAAALEAARSAFRAAPLRGAFVRLK